jgi:hypothetical protein
MKSRGFVEMKYYTRQFIRLPPIRLFKNIDVEKINDRLEIKHFGTTLVGIFKKRNEVSD